MTTSTIEPWSPFAFAVASEVAYCYRDPALGLADASLVVLARRHGTRRIISFNERDFRVVTPLQGGAFALLPADA